VSLVFDDAGGAQIAVEAAQDVPEEERTVAPPAGLPVDAALTEIAQAVLDSVLWQRRVSKAKNVSFVFKYVRPYGPRTHANTSQFFRSAEAAASAIATWAGSDWRRRVACVSLSSGHQLAVSAPGMRRALDVERKYERQLSSQIHVLRSRYHWPSNGLNIKRGVV
jgi:hypothetical protein